MTKTVIAFTARPEQSVRGQGIINWYTNHGYLDDFLEAFALEGEMTYNTTTNLYEISFVPNEFWPKTLEKQAQEADICLGNPDDDGNYPINGYVVTAQIKSINGQPVTNH